MRLVFIPPEIYFGDGIVWEDTRIYQKNGKFAYIDFIKIFYYDEEALKFFNEVKNMAGKKYPLKEESNKGDTEASYQYTDSQGYTVGLYICKLTDFWSVTYPIHFYYKSKLYGEGQGFYDDI